MSPLTLPIQGGVLTLNGTSLGPGPCEDRGQRSAVVLHITPTPDVSGSTSLTFHPTTRTWSSSPPLMPREVECAAIDWTPSSIVCRVPPGLDASVQVVVYVGGQSAVAQDTLQFEAPVLASIIAPGPVGTPGGAVVTITGSGFPLPPWPIAVLVGDALCVTVNASRVSTTSLDCVVPRGAGTVLVTVFTPLQGSNSSVTLTYAAPTIARVSTPDGRPIAGGFRVEVEGEVGVCGEKIEVPFSIDAILTPCENLATTSSCTASLCPVTRVTCQCCHPH